MSPTSQDIPVDDFSGLTNWTVSFVAVTGVCNNDPSFFVQFLENNISGKNPDKSTAIFYKADANQPRSACFSKALQIQFATVSGCCS